MEQYRRRLPEMVSPEEEENSLISEIRNAKATPQQAPMQPQQQLMDFPVQEAGQAQERAPSIERYRGMDRENQPSMTERWDGLDEGTKRTWMRGATPLLVGLLTGNIGDAAEIAGKGLMEEDKMLRDEQTTSIAEWHKDRRAKAKAAAAGDEPSNIQKQQFSEGEMGYFDRSTKKFYDTKGNVIEDPKGYQGIPLDKFGKKERLKETARYEGDVATPPNWTRSKDAKIERVLPRYNKKIEDAEETYSNLESALSGIGRGEFRSKLAVMKLVKEVETRLSDADREFYLGKYGFVDKIKHLVSRTTSDDLPDDVLQQAHEMIQQSLSRKQKAMDKINGRYLKQLSSSGIPEDYARSRLGMSPKKVSKAKSKYSDKSDAELEKRRQEVLKKLER